jgi:hypothetical protein
MDCRTGAAIDAHSAVDDINSYPGATISNTVLAGSDVFAIL